MKKKRPIRSAFGVQFRLSLSRGKLTGRLLLPLLGVLLLRWGTPMLVRLWPPAQRIAPYREPLFLALLLATAWYWLKPAALFAAEERRRGVDAALTRTPLGLWGYRASRLGLPLVLTALYAAFAGALWTLGRRLPTGIGAGVLAALAGLAVLLPAALGKTSAAAISRTRLGLLFSLAGLLGYALPWQWQPVLSWIPSFWVYRFLTTGDWLLAAVSAGVSGLWLWVFLPRCGR